MFARAEPLEAFVVEAVLHRLDSPELATALAGGNGDPGAERWQREVQESQAQLDGLAGLYGQREISFSEWRAARAPIEQRVTDAKKQLAKLSRTTSLGGFVGKASLLRERWPELPLTRQHAIVAAVLDHIVVSPGRRGFNGFEHSRFNPVWRA